MENVFVTTVVTILSVNLTVMETTVVRYLVGVILSVWMDTVFVTTVVTILTVILTVMETTVVRYLVE